MMDKKLIFVLQRAGPLTGAQLLERTGMDVFLLWQTCRKSPNIKCRIVGRRFLRLDRVVEGYARLSPSIRREFQTYTVLGLPDQDKKIGETAQRLEQEIKNFSRAKLNLARASMVSVVSSLPEPDLIRNKVCFIIAGDITYEMAHTVPRPEQSTGKMVRGSDLDIVVIADDHLAEKYIKTLDGAIHDRKYFLLVHPDYREEIDYLIKTLSRLREQLGFNTFKSMVACKILREGEFLYGSSSLFQTVKELIDEYNIPDKLDRLQEQALINREKAEIYLLNLKTGLFGSKFYNLFYTREERLEDLY